MRFSFTIQHPLGQIEQPEVSTPAPSAGEHLWPPRGTAPAQENKGTCGPPQQAEKLYCNCLVDGSSVFLKHTTRGQSIHVYCKSPKAHLQIIPTLNKGICQAGHYTVGSILSSIGDIHLIHRDQERPTRFLFNLYFSGTLQKSYTD